MIGELLIFSVICLTLSLIAAIFAMKSCAKLKLGLLRRGKS